MKIRNGFVSNSSSSSFILGIKKDKKINVDMLIEYFRVPKDSPLFNFVHELVESFIINVRDSDPLTLESISDDYGIDFPENATKKQILSLLNDEYPFHLVPKHILSKFIDFITANSAPSTSILK